MLPLIGFSQNNKLQGKAGFENYVFGTPPSQYKNLTLEIEEGNTKLFSALPEINVTGIEISDVNITFLKNQLATICYKTKNSTGKKFLQSLKENYGAPTKSDPAKGNFEWMGDKLHLVYEQNKGNNDATVSFYSKELYSSARKK